MRILAAALVAVLAAACSRTPTAPASVAGELPAVVVHKRVTPIRAALPRPAGMVPPTAGGAPRPR